MVDQISDSERPEAADEESVFKRLSSIDLDKKVKQKGNFWYVPWSGAVRELLKHYPDSTWEFTKFGDSLEPFLKTNAGCFVECTVTVRGIKRTLMLPVLDHSNKVLENPDAGQVNKAQMRALTKAIALHGFGLELWAGEDPDYPDEPDEPGETEATQNQANHCPQDHFDGKFPEWEKLVLDGQKTTEQIIAFINKKGFTLSDDQLKRINGIGK